MINNQNEYIENGDDTNKLNSIQISNYFNYNLNVNNNDFTEKKNTNNYLKIIKFLRLDMNIIIIKYYIIIMRI